MQHPYYNGAQAPKKAAYQHREGVDTTSTSTSNLVDVKHDFHKFAAYFYYYCF